jgi:release factor glutamine methyltransferase
MTYRQLWQRLVPVYGEGEAQAIARLIYEVRYGLTLSDLLMGRDSSVPQDELEQIAIRLERQEPVQYILGQTEFCGRTFVVNKHVLIPRPETAELCQWIVLGNGLQGCKKILDIGTGSGCIAITLAAEMPEAEVTAWDISEKALKVVEENAKRTDVHVKFEQVDILHLPSSILHLTSAFDLIVSNPPYICNKERETMETNVLEHEPHTALFVPDDNPLLFYRAIAQYGQTALKEGGWLYFEINPLYAEPLQDMLSKMSYHDIEIKGDQYGKQRMIRAKKGKKVKR